MATMTTQRTLDIKRVASARQPYRRNGYSGPAVTDFYWVVVDEAGRRLDILCTLKRAKAAVADLGAKVGKIIR